MDNVVQHISINDIIPTNFIPTKDEKLKIEELAILIKQFGLLDPILVRPRNNKYEIIMGIDKYQAALLANLTKLPVIVRELDDETFKKYLNVDTNKMIDLPSSPKETYIKSKKDSDIVNLSELSKINLEYERDDTNMNNTQFTNDMTNNFNQSNMNNQNIGPAFGGRFFPSLEDEPTNMNMMGGMNSSATPSVNSSISNNGLIDLTDLSPSKDVPNGPIIDYSMTNNGMPNMVNNATNIMPDNNLVVPTNDFLVQNSNPINGVPNDTIINIENLQNNNPAAQQISEPVSMDILNADFGAPQQVLPSQPSIPPFDTVMPNMNGVHPQGFEVQQNMVQPEFNLNQQPIMEQPMFDVNQVSTQSINQPIYAPNMNIEPSLNQTNVPNFEQSLMPNFEINQSMPLNNEQTGIASNLPSKDITPVVNTIKNLVTSLEKFGFKINVNEENLATVSKLTIEIEK